eukprot:TRINITY_DN10392_c0_g2_i2.p1 TRINITY_DN10392_c0_g2~~TRINITY_DN10392_c0_g2_i2.p1  ORF type:complete len:810 (-),score=121.96 TRINITY_DN10392_c0_g2_i2:142-2571(-)
MASTTNYDYACALEIREIIANHGGSMPISLLGETFYQTTLGKEFRFQGLRLTYFLQSFCSKLWTIGSGGSAKISLLSSTPATSTSFLNTDQALIDLVNKIIQSTGQDSCSLDYLAKKLFTTPPHGTEFYDSGEKISDLIKRHPEEWWYFSPRGGGLSTVRIKPKKQIPPLHPQVENQVLNPVDEISVPVLIPTFSALSALVDRILVRCEIIAVDCEFTQPHRKLALVQLATEWKASYIIDLLSNDMILKIRAVIDQIQQIMASESILKVFHGSSEDIQILSSYGIQLKNIADTQLMFAYHHNITTKGQLPQNLTRSKPCLGLNKLLKKYDLPHNLHKEDLDQRKWHVRPLTPIMIEYAAADVLQLIPLYRVLKKDIESVTHFWWESVIEDHLEEISHQQISDTPKGSDYNEGEEYYLSFEDEGSRKKAVRTLSSETGTKFKISAPPYETSSMKLLLAVLPPVVSTAIINLIIRRNLFLVEIVADQGKPFILRCEDKQEYDLDIMVDVEQLVNYLSYHLKEEIDILFSSDNRAGIPGTLHRISCIRNKVQKIIGLTYRVGRQVTGTVNLILDILSDLVPNQRLHTSTYKSILLVGAPGRGKTTLLREISHTLSEIQREVVIIVDSSDEIAGASDIPHPCVGRSRRMSVFNRSRQHDVMIEAVQNHNPSVIIIDEIGTKEEVAAVRTISQRGVGLVGTAHGTTISTLLSNSDLSNLVGGLKSVTLGDEEAIKRAPFSCLIELMDRNHFRIFRPLGKRVSELLGKDRCLSEERWVDEDGMLRSKFCFYSKPDSVDFEEVRVLKNIVNKPNMG